MSVCDTILLGLGGVGSAAALHLARRGGRVLGFEQFAPAHDRGSSHGQLRIIRKAYFEHPNYVPLLIRAYELWDELTAESRQPLFERCGLLECGPPAGVVIAGVLRSARDHNLPIEQVAAADFARRFPGFRCPEDAVALFERDAGFLRVEDCVRAHLDLAKHHGADLRFNESVRSWSADERSVTVETDSGRHTAARLIICGGAWSTNLLRDLRIPLALRRKMQLWFGPAAPEYRLDRGCPAFAYHIGDRFFYGFPSIPAPTSSPRADSAPTGATPTIKVAEHTGGDPLSDPAALDRTLRATDTTRVVAFLTKHLPGVTATVQSHSACMYTMSPDEHFIIDHHPHHPNVAFAAGLSGHGFKFATVLGEILADLALTNRTRHPIDFLSLRRFRSALTPRQPHEPLS